MPEQKESSLSSLLLVRGIILGSAGAGLIHGFYDAQGVYLSYSTEQLLTFGPLLAAGAASAAHTALGLEGKLGDATLKQLQRHVPQGNGFARHVLWDGVAGAFWSGGLTVLGYLTGRGLGYLLR